MIYTNRSREIHSAQTSPGEECPTHHDSDRPDLAWGQAHVDKPPMAVPGQGREGKKRYGNNRLLGFSGDVDLDGWDMTALFSEYFLVFGGGSGWIRGPVDAAKPLVS